VRHQERNKKRVGGLANLGAGLVGPDEGPALPVLGKEGSLRVSHPANVHVAVLHDSSNRSGSTGVHECLSCEVVKEVVVGLQEGADNGRLKGVSLSRLGLLGKKLLCKVHVKVDPHIGGCPDSTMTVINSIHGKGWGSLVSKEGVHVREGDVAILHGLTNTLFLPNLRMVELGGRFQAVTERRNEKISGHLKEGGGGGGGKKKKERKY